MIKLLVLAVVLTAVLAQVRVRFSREENLAWEKFQAKYDKHYASPTEKWFRKLIFVDNFRDILAHNELYKEGKVTFSEGVSSLTDFLGIEVPMGFVYPKRHEHNV